MQVTFDVNGLVTGGRTLGTLSFGTRKRPAFDDEELFLMRNIADHVAVNLQQSALVEELSRRAEELAEKDRRKDVRDVRKDVRK
jgi:GAF domain-containing protein